MKGNCFAFCVWGVGLFGRGFPGVGDLGWVFGCFDGVGRLLAKCRVLMVSFDLG